MKPNKSKIELLLRAFKSEHISQIEVVDALVDICKTGKHLNYPSFSWGVATGVWVFIIIKLISKL